MALDGFYSRATDQQSWKSPLRRLAGQLARRGEGGGIVGGGDSCPLLIMAAFYPLRCHFPQQRALCVAATRGKEDWCRILLFMLHGLQGIARGEPFAFEGTTIVLYGQWQTFWLNVRGEPRRRVPWRRRP